MFKLASLWLQMSLITVSLMNGMLHDMKLYVGNERVGQSKSFRFHWKTAAKRYKVEVRGYIRFEQ
jgi:hypothetical protein